MSELGPDRPVSFEETAWPGENEYCELVAKALLEENPDMSDEEFDYRYAQLTGDTIPPHRL